MTRIAVLTTSYPNDDDDASGHFVRAEVNRLERAGARVEVFVPRGAAFGWPGVAARLRERPWRAPSVPIEMVRIAQALRGAGRFDRTVAHFAIPSALPLAFFLEHRGDLEIVSHGGDVRLLAALPAVLRHRAVRTMLRHARSWRFPSVSLREELTSVLAREQARALDRVSLVMPPAMELPDLRDEIGRIRQGEAAKMPFWVCAARLIPSKRVDWAIVHAAERGARLVIVGDGPERGRLEALARARGAEARFVGLRPRRETLAWIAVADALVHASEVEGLSTVVREAEALGTRIISPGCT